MDIFIIQAKTYSSDYLKKQLYYILFHLTIYINISLLCYQCLYSVAYLKQLLIHLLALMFPSSIILILIRLMKIYQLIIKMCLEIMIILTNFIDFIILYYILLYIYLYLYYSILFII